MEFVCGGGENEFGGSDNGNGDGGVGSKGELDVDWVDNNDDDEE